MEHKVPPSSGGRYVPSVRVLEADEGELSVVRNVGVLVKRTARAAELRERGDRRQQDEADQQ